MLRGDIAFVKNQVLHADRGFAPVAIGLGRVAVRRCLTHVVPQGDIQGPVALDQRGVVAQLLVAAAEDRHSHANGGGAGDGAGLGHQRWMVGWERAGGVVAAGCSSAWMALLSRE